jgi:hypothetical protein
MRAYRERGQGEAAAPTGRKRLLKRFAAGWRAAAFSTEEKTVSNWETKTIGVTADS